MAIRKALTDEQASRYRASTYRERKRILDEFVKQVGYNRKYASHLLSRWGLCKFVTLDDELVRLKAGRRKATQRQGHRTYGGQVDLILERLWNLFDRMCGKRLVAAIRDSLPQVAAPLGIPPDLIPSIRAMSPATMDRHLAAARRREPLKALCLTKPVSGLKALIPTRTCHDWADSVPGFFQADTVGHAGGSSYGDFCFTLDLVDVSSGWTGLQALLNKACRWVRGGLADIRDGLPFPLLGINSDSGGEFINETIYAFCKPDIMFTRSRPNRKNDNCYVECKNDTAVRQHVGYARFSGEVARAALAEVYLYLCPLINHVYPSMRLREKVRVGSKIIKRYDAPRTPYQRLLDDPRLGQEYKDRLRREHEGIDILALTRSLDEALAQLADCASHYQNGARGSGDLLPPVVRKFG